MIDPIQILSVGISFALLVLVLELVRRGQLGEEFSLLWIISAVGLLVISIWRKLFIDRLALWLGIHYPPALLLLALVFVVFLATLFFSVAISRQRQQIRKLAVELALLDARVREIGTGDRGLDSPHQTSESKSYDPKAPTAESRD